MKTGFTSLATALGAARAGLGVGYMFAPKLLNILSFGPSADSAPLRVTNMMLGSREVLMGGVTIAAARTKSTRLPVILLASSVVDAWDSLAAVSTRGMNRSTKLTVGTVALTASALEAIAASRARRQQVAGEPASLWSAADDAARQARNAVSH